MKAKRKRIAIFVGQADEAYQSKFITGFLQNAFAYDLDVCVFAMYRKYQNNSDRERGESNIFLLPDLDTFSAAVILEDTIQTDGAGERLEEHLHKNFPGRPVLVIEKESPYFPSILTDGYSGVYELVSHLIEVHGCRDIAFLSGKRWHKHSLERQKAYTDALVAHGIEPAEDRVIFGDFWYQSGELCADLLIKDKNLPQAVVCANDAMAVGLCKALTEHGLRIPEDIRVVSYDSTYEGQTSPKTITSALIPVQEFGSYAADYIHNALEGRDTPAFGIKPSLVIGETCGCEHPTIVVPEARRAEWGTEISEEGFDSVHNMFFEDVISQTNLMDFLGIVYSYAYQVKNAESVHLCLCSTWKYMAENAGIKVIHEGYTDNMIHAVRYNRDNKDGLAGIERTFATKRLLPDFDSERDKPAAFFFTPVFSGEQCFGYAAVSYGSVPRSYDDVFRRWIGFVSAGLECLRRYLALEKSREQLDKVRTSKFAAADAAYDTLSEDEKKDYRLVSQILDENLLTYHFQPIVSTSDGSIFSYEALMRSDTEVRIPPLSIIKYSDMQSRLADVERATFFNVLKIVEQRKAELGSAKVFINSIPGVRVYGDDFEIIEEYLKRNSDTVVVELTEDAELNDNELSRLKEMFKRLNIEIAVDDYGTGYSNVNNLLRYMPNYVKIDRALLADIQDKPQKKHFVKEIIGFCHDNGIKALAEGVETSEELQTVVHLGADLIQGYYTGKPSPHFIEKIDPAVRDEIKKYYLERLEGISKQDYIAGKTNRIPLTGLAREGYAQIVVGQGPMLYKEIAVIGTPNAKTDIHMRIEPGYVGRITLENVYFSNSKTRPCIDIGENADVTLEIEGENILHGSGIRVPKSSRLTFEGSGNMDIQLNSPDYYGIGDLPNAEHGDLIFNMTGLMEILGRGVMGTCIGSGLGGKIRINSGQYILEATGSSGVCIGALTGKADIEIVKSNVSLEFVTTDGVGVGSLANDAKILISNSAFMLYGDGHEVAAIGTLTGGLAQIELFGSSPIVNLSADKVTAIGALSGRTELKARSCVIKLDCSGDEAVAVGGMEDNFSADLFGTDIRWNIHNKTGRDICFKEQDLRCENGRQRFMLNDMEVRH